MSEVKKSRMLLALAVIGALMTAVMMWMISTSAEAQQQNRNTVYGLTSDNRLVSFAVGSPGNFRTSIAITGLDSGENLVGMDMRPATNRLFAISDDSNLYRINPDSGVATPMPLADPEEGDPVELQGTAFGVDFNPMADALRIVSNTGQNLRIPFADGMDGRVILADTPLSYSGLLAPQPRISGAAYNNNVPNAASTTLYDIDFSSNIVATQTPANNGTLQEVGELGVDTTSMVGFDIAPVRGALAALKMPEGRSELYRINLGTGDATSIGMLQRNVIDIAIQLPPIAPPEETTGN